ncbi:MAG: uncharacterized protein KVP18_001280 [Porospora cf. gigantea A]|nr:MAG: hypothetical protein KVP18_001280 [Porospora cf. gigantea A]
MIQREFPDRNPLLLADHRLTKLLNGIQSEISEEGVLGLIDDLASCRIGSVTILEHILHLGLKSALSSPLTDMLLLRPVRNFHPFFHLSPKANTLLHFASKSNDPALLKKFLQRIQRADLWPEGKPFTGPMWVLSAFQHSNESGCSPLDCISNAEARRTLLGDVRAYMGSVQSALENAAQA